MVRDGVYQAIYSGSQYAARGVFVFRNGAFVGIGQTGAIYEGAYWANPGTNTFEFDGCVRFPAGIPLVTGPATSPEPVIIPFKGRGPEPAPEANFTLMLDGQPVEVSMSYVCPIPG
jgi:hypothetical protein